MTHFVAIVEDAGPNTAVGIWFPDLPGCFSAGDTVEEALANAEGAIAAVREQGGRLPQPRRIAEIREDPALSAELAEHMIALIPASTAADAA